MGIIKYRLNADSPWVEIPALKGDKGDDGATPVKGVDYFTAEEIAEIEANVAAKVDLSEYPTITDMNDYVNEVATEIETITIPNALKDYALAEHEHENYAELSDLPNMEDYYRKEEVDSFLRVKANANHSHSNYLTETQVQALIDTSLGVIENGTY